MGKYKVFDSHVHCNLHIKMHETIDAFKKIFGLLGVDKEVFLCLPTHAKESGGKDVVQNAKGLFLKKAFSPNAYCFAGLNHKDSYLSDEERAEDYYLQAKSYNENGYDGIKMLEGYPNLRKEMGIPLCDKVYDKFYQYLQDNGVPITMHLANPDEFWDINKVDKWSLEHGRYCDETYPTKEQLHQEVFEILRKFPNLHLTLAHFGFMTKDVEMAKKFFSFKNTMLDMTPGGEQFFNMKEDWAIWEKFFYEYSDRIKFGTDTYPTTLKLSNGDKQVWERSVSVRPMLIHNFFETTTEHTYQNKTYVGVGFDDKIIKKLYFENAYNQLGEPKKINVDYLISELKKLKHNENLTELQSDDVEFMTENF